MDCGESRPRRVDWLIVQFARLAPAMLLCGTKVISIFIVSGNLKNKVVEYSTKQGLLCCGDRVLVGVSGGPDSVALLHVLYELRDEFGLHLEVAHLHHGIRGEAAEDDARFVFELAKQLALPFHLKKVDLPQMKLDAGKGNLEALGRKERYRFFAAVVEKHRLDKAATAHTRDDQAETVMMWLLRGSGMRGLGGMRPLQRVKTGADGSANRLVVIRPLLDVSKAEALEYLRAHGFEHRVDQTNQDARLLRNWIRSELIPKLKERSDRHFPARLAHQAELLRDDDLVLQEFARRELQRIERAGALDRKLLLEQPVALQRRVLRLWIEESRGDLRGLDFTHVDALLELIANGPPHGRLALPGGLELIKEYKSLRLVTRQRRPRKAPCYSYELQIGTPLSIPEAGVTVRSERISPPLAGLPDGRAEAVFDAPRLPERLTVRNFRRGDRIQPLGMAGHKKVKDLFIERKTPLSVRSTLPIVVAGSEILWIPGHGRSEAAKIGPETQTILRLQVIPGDSFGGERC